MKNDLLYSNYKKSLEQKYNAVCFDIDGTLTIQNSKTIDDRAIEMIVNLLNKKIPVVFITGRGETGLNNLKDDIYNRIKTAQYITDSDIKRIYVLTNDGARLFYSLGISKDEFLRENIYISSKEELEQLLNVKENIEIIKEKSKYSDNFKITYSKDLVTGEIINIRLVFNTKNNEGINSIIDIIQDYITRYGLSGVHLTRGIYEGNYVVQIGTATKDIAIERTEKLIGVPRNSMIRIGDCGDLHGNDYAMLNCMQGYSVDKTSDSVNSCFPVFDENGNILKGVDATLYLIKNAKILPTVCIEKADKKDYMHQFANVERNIVFGRQKLTNLYNNIINNNFHEYEGIYGVFDKYSGSIKIPMYEWELLENSPLKELWLTLFDGKQIYSIRDDNNYLLRGSSTYYYFISNRISSNGVDITSKKDVICWHENYIKFFDDSLQAFLYTNNINDSGNKKLLLGILDNCRNVLLILLNHYLVSNYIDKNVLLDISFNKVREVLEIYNNILMVEKTMSDICFQSNYIINRNSIIEIIKGTQYVLIRNLQNELNREEKKNYSKDYRAYREIDNFAENYIAVSLYNKKSNNIKSFNACGLSYGGIELPILAKIINPSQIERLLLLKFNKEVSGYTNKQLIDLRRFNINNFGGIINSEGLKNSLVDLFDDNVLTGKTLQLAINSLFDCAIAVNNICIVRYPSINRIDQMFFDNPAAVDYHLFFDYIYGLCFSSPYSWKDNSWKKDNGQIDYTDTLGVFDLNRKKIIECLLKNHDYSENSEVGEYKRRIIK